MKTARCPSCKSTGILVGYTRIPGESIIETYLCLKCGGRFTVPLKGEETKAEAA
jgi:DNA-directed RNA polymerase subunit RPC12/RpoP